MKDINVRWGIFRFTARHITAKTTHMSVVAVLEIDHGLQHFIRLQRHMEAMRL